MRLPDLVAYQTAIQHPSTAFTDPQLRAATVTTGRLGLPRAVAGNFAVTYQLREGSRRWAVRCFHREAADRGSRYAAISQALSQLRDGPLVGIQYFESGLRVGQTWYPITKMPWIDGQPLNVAIESSLNAPTTLAALERSFIDLVADLRRRGIAHGDLQHGNILVAPGGMLRLVDYDGMFVPALRGRPASESGDPNYQHPRRGTQFDLELDRFAALVIVVALRALAVAPRLWQTYSTGDNLLFRRADFADPSRSALFRELTAQPTLQPFAERLALVCTEDYARIPLLDDFLRLRVPTARRVATVRQPSTLSTAGARSWKLQRATPQYALAFSADGSQLATADHTGKISIRSTVAGRTERTLRLPRFSGVLRAVAFATSGTLVAVTTDGPRLTVWNAADRQPIFEHTLRGRAVRGVALSATGEWLAATSDDGTLWCWRLSTARLVVARVGATTALAISNDGRSVVTGAGRGQVTVWRVRDGERIAAVNVSARPGCVALSADGQLVCVGSTNGHVTVWKVASGHLAYDTITLESTVLAVALNAHAAAATTADGAICLRTLRRAPRPTPLRDEPPRLIRVFDWLRRVALL